MDISKFRVYNPETKKLSYSGQFVISVQGKVFELVNDQLVPRPSYIATQAIGISDIKGSALYEGDYVEDGKGQCFAIKYKYPSYVLEDTSRQSGQTYQMNGVQYKRVGNIFTEWVLPSKPKPIEREGAEGWTWPKHLPKAHYFVSEGFLGLGYSLCGRHVYSVINVVQGNDNSEDNCVKCVKALARRMVKETRR